MDDPQVQVVPAPFTSTPTGRAIKTVGAGIAGALLTAALQFVSNASNIQPLISIIQDPLYQKLIFLAISGAVSWIGRWSKNNGLNLGAI